MYHQLRNNSRNQFLWIYFLIQIQSDHRNKIQFFLIQFQNTFFFLHFFWNGLLKENNLKKPEPQHEIYYINFQKLRNASQTNLFPQPTEKKIQFISSTDSHIGTKQATMTNSLNVTKQALTKSPIQMRFDKDFKKDGFQLDVMKNTIFLRRGSPNLASDE
ncbi:hypothetical protein pb186bvf_007575 [Paramecium bursaria]